jgi:hypothetical protein
MPNGNTSNPNDFRVVTFTNKTDFAFTPELGCMYDSRPIFGKSGASVEPGESVVLPYHVGNLIAKNLAKAAMNRNAGTDAAGIPTGVPLWSEDILQQRQASYITEMYTEEKPTAMTETDRLMAKVDEYAKLVEKLLPGATGDNTPAADPENIPEVPPAGAQTPVPPPTGYTDKADVIAELQKRQIPFDARKSKADLEKLLVN